MDGHFWSKLRKSLWIDQNIKQLGDSRTLGNNSSCLELESYETSCALQGQNMCQSLAKPFSSSSNFSKSQTWFDMKVFYVRISTSRFNNPALIPEVLTIHYLPRSSFTALEINGRRIHPSFSAFLTLRRSPVEEDGSGDISYVNTDSIRTTGSICFDVYIRNETLIAGTLEKKLEENGNERLTRCLDPVTWMVKCRCALEYSSKFLPKSSSPALEVYVAGRVCGFPVILAQAVRLIPRRRRLRHHSNALDVIPEGNENEWSFASPPQLDLRDTNDDNNYLDCGSQESEDSWFTSSLRYGIGVGLCVGIGLLMRSYVPLRIGFK